MTDYEEQHRKAIAKAKKIITGLFDETEAAFVQLQRTAGSAELSKSPQLKSIVEGKLLELSRNIVTTIDNGITAAWARSNTKNDALEKKVRKGRTFRPLENYDKRSSEALEAFRNRKIEGLNLSQRVWKLVEQHKIAIEDAIEMSIKDGASAQQLSRSVRSYLVAPDKLFRRVRDEHGTLRLSKRAAAYHPGRGVYRSSAKNAMRLAATEINMAYRSADHLRWLGMDFVIGVKISLSQSHKVGGAFHECICDQFVGSYPKDFKFVGWHPFCRCIATPILKSEAQMDEEDDEILKTGRISDPDRGNITEVPEGFAKWSEKNRARLTEAAINGKLPYFVKDNFHYFEAAKKKNNEAPKETPKESPKEKPKEKSKESSSAQEKKLQAIIQEVKSAGVAYKKVQPLGESLSEEAIIERIGGGDLTKGSCSSLAFAYAGNKGGHDVLDFRDGKSRKFFANGWKVEEIIESAGGIVEDHMSDFIAVDELFLTVEAGKEYYLATGRHAAIIRKGDSGFEYLELQSRIQNGWKTLDKKSLRKRFKASRRTKYYGSSFLVGIEKLNKCADFVEMLGYINTAENKQRKGAKGSIK